MALASILNTARISRTGGLLAWLLLSVVLAIGLAQKRLAERQEAFDVDARIAHRLLSQKAVQHDAVLATLALSQPDMQALGAKLAAVYPQILAVERRAGADPWAHDAADFARAEASSRQAGHPVLASLDAPRGRYWLVHAASPYSYALHIDARAMVPSTDWPLPADSPVRAVLETGAHHLLLQPGVQFASPWYFMAKKRLAAPSQPLDVVLDRHVAWAELPWSQALAGSALIALGLWSLATLLRQRDDKRRAENLLRLGQVARLNTLGELAAGMAHELNQPLTAVLANTQAAARLLADDPVDLATIRSAMDQAAQQARRASEVVSRLRRTVERPDMGAPRQDMDLVQVVHKALDMLEPECRRRAVQVQQLGPGGGPLRVHADPVALEQIVHNLLMNALQALERVPGARQLSVVLSAQAGISQGAACLVVRDNGPGIAPDALPRLFEPFFTTREGGLGLGLSLCETLAQGMNATLVARNAEPRGAEFALTLPLAPGGPAQSDA